MPNDFDKASRFAFKLDPAGLLAWSLNLPSSDFAFRRWLDTRNVPFPGNTDRTGDSVAGIDDLSRGGIPWLFAVEFQTEPDPLMFGRMLGYLSGLWLDLKPDPEPGSRYWVAGVILNLTGQTDSSRLMDWPEAGVRSHMLFRERNLESESADATLTAIETGRVHAAVLPWISLMRGGDEEGIIGRWKALAEAEPDSRRRGDYAGLALIFADACGRWELWKSKLKGWNVKTSRQADEWRAEGREEGREMERRDKLKRILSKRFGIIPVELVATIDSTDDASMLDEWFDSSLDAVGFDDMRARMQS